ncbi:unnamed protein product [Musa acuminata subsp. malaccensis]|uniref:(wild Malaysian banana) hypothetical protein n=1 Tax=Musa acuminata subsp. malaccensis TaxID=214687 RepID=A0A8D7FMA4_MUSAM|nr:unnamed protein product [Musa acuminata subsp. malaccensis]
MVKRWGFYLPLELHGRGRGSRAALKWFKYGALLHDASYCLPIQILPLLSVQDSILAVLRMVLFLSPYVPSTAPEKLCNQVAHGVCYGKAMLYHIEAPVSNLISPVIYMWQPFLRDSDHANAEKDGDSNSSGSTHKDECSSPIRKLWIWIHAAAFCEGFGVIDNACQNQPFKNGIIYLCWDIEMHECGVYVRCFSLEGQIARLEVMGSKAIKMIKKILHPVSQSCSSADDSLLNQSSLTPCSNSQAQKSILLCHAEKLPSHAILSLTWNFLSDSISLWDCSNNLNPPVPESIICKEKHDRRLKDFYLEPSSHAGAATEVKDCPSRTCPVLLLKHADYSSFCMGWSIILPLSWIKTFWTLLVSHGCHAIGLRERRWVASNSGLPSFPFDFPDCKAYTSFMADEAAAFDTASELCPLAVRPSRVPIKSPSNSIVSTIIKGPNILRGYMTLDAQTSSGIIPENSILDVDSKDKASSPERQVAVLFPGFIARTSKVLDWYLKKIGCRNLLSLPDVQIAENSTLDWVKISANVMHADSKLCLLRVMLHAYKEGVFEDGAIVCAPNLTDLSRWTSRSEGEEDLEELQVPQSFVRSCFTEQNSGKWELQDCEDSLALQTFRWPIGFVTTGFVRGSSKPVAEAFCEARLLAMLRGQESCDTLKQQRLRFLCLSEI